MNWNCKLADWVGQAKGYPDMCFLPEEVNGPQDAFLYGDCIFDTHTKGSLALADEILAAAATKNSLSAAPLRNTILQVSKCPENRFPHHELIQLGLSCLSTVSLCKRCSNLEIIW